MSRKKPHQQLVGSVGRATDFFQQIANAVYARHGSDRDLHQVLHDDVFRRRLAAIIVDQPDLVPWADREQIPDLTDFEETEGMADAAAHAYRFMYLIRKDVQELGGDEESMRRVLKDCGLVERLADCMTDRTCTRRVKLGSGRTLREMIELGRYDWVDPEPFGDPSFSSLTDIGPGEGEREVVMTLLHFRRNTSPTLIRRKMAERQLRAVKLMELLALAAQYPELQREFTLFALDHGSSRPAPGNRTCRSYPNAGHSGPTPDERMLMFSWLEDGQQDLGDCLFVGLPEAPKES